MVTIFYDQNSWRISSHINAHSSNVPHDAVFFTQSFALTENVPKGHFQRLLAVALRMYLTLYLLLFAQSM